MYISSAWCATTDNNHIKCELSNCTFNYKSRRYNKETTEDRAYNKTFVIYLPI